jgi:hypothetical protein
MAKGNLPVDQIKKEAFGALSALKDNLPKGCKLSIEDEDEVVISALKRHGEHLSTHAVNQGHVDPFKLICWIGRAIIERLEKEVSYHQHATILDALIFTLEQILVLETKRIVRLTINDRELLKRLVMEEIKGNGNHGIGFNGLFIAFHCFRSTYNQLANKIS